MGTTCNMIENPGEFFLKNHANLCRLNHFFIGREQNVAIFKQGRILHAQTNSSKRGHHSSAGGAC